MKKNVMMRIASFLLIAVLLTTCAISGTYAKYVTSVTGFDSARVAKWGFTGEDSDIVFANLFVTTYKQQADNTKNAVNSAKDVIAPGTSGEGTFTFEYTAGTTDTVNAPEVAYTFTVSTAGSTCANSIQNNKNIIWSLDGVDCTNWEDLLDKIKALSGDASGTKTYLPGEFPDQFEPTNSHTVAWRWLIDDANTYDKNPDGVDVSPVWSQDQYDTYMGNSDDLGDVTLKITITATQID